MSAPRIILASLQSFCQNLSKLVEIWWSSDKNNFAQFFETRCIELHRVSKKLVDTDQMKETMNNYCSRKKTPENYW